MRCRYELVSIVVHHGFSVSSGHYVAFVKAANGVWHLCDDARVCRVKPEIVLKQQAYILMYVRIQPRTWLAPGQQTASAQAAGGNVSAPLQTRAAAAAASGALRGGDSSAADAASDGAQLPGDFAAAGRRNATRSESDNAAAGIPQSNALHQQQAGDTAQQQHADADAAAPAPAHASGSVIGTPPCNRRVSRMVARSLPWQGRSTKQAAQLQSAARNLQRKSLMLRRLANGSAALDAGVNDISAAHADASKENQSPPPHALARAVEDAPSSHHHSGDTAATHLADAGNKRSNGATPQAVRIAPGEDELLRGAGRRQLPAMGAWDDVDPAERRSAQKLVERAQPKRKALDEYDAEYDKGRTKKVRNKVQGSGPRAAAFVAAATAHASGKQSHVKSKGGGKASGKRRGRVAAMQAAAAH